MTPAAPAEMRFSRVQVLRFFAALSVVALHALAGAMDYLGRAPLLGRPAVGQYGVDLFFVISGFIIAWIAYARERAPGPFLLRRIQRVVPAYWIYTLLFFGAQLLITALNPSMFRSQASSFELFVRSMTFSSWLDGSGFKPTLPPGWTLEYEMFFYALFAAAMLVSKRPALIVTFVFGAIILSAATVLRGASGPLADFLFNPLLFDFIFGMFCAQMLIDRRQALAMAPVMLMLPVLVIAGLVPWYSRVVLGGVPALLLVGTAVWLDLRRGPLTSRAGRLLEHLGDASYSIYLVHGITQAIFLKIGWFARWMPVELLALLVTLGSVATGYVMYWVVERPIRRWFEQRRQASTPPRFAAA